MTTQKLLQCAQCGESYEASVHDVNRGRKFCSQRCMGAARSAKHRETRSCAACGEAFEAKLSSDRKTCSSDCAHEMIRRGKLGERNPMKRPEVAAANHLTFRARRQAFDHDVPGEERDFCNRPGCENPISRAAMLYCSPRCHYQDRKRRGFRVNATPKREFRDEHPCRGCGARAVHNHHVVFRQHIFRAGGDRWHPDIALALCFPCHTKAHKYELPLTVLRDENFAFAESLLGVGAAYNYLRRRYAGDDPRLDALLAESVAA